MKTMTHDVVVTRGTTVVTLHYHYHLTNFNFFNN